MKKIASVEAGERFLAGLISVGTGRDDSRMLLEDAVIAPSTLLRGSPHWWTRREQGVFDARDRFVPELNDVRGEREIFFPRNIAPPRRGASGEVRLSKAVYAGTIYPHFGHMLLDLSRLYEFLGDPAFDALPIIFHWPMNMGWSSPFELGYVRAFFDLLRIRERAVIVTTQIRVDKLFSVPALFSDCNYVLPRMTVARVVASRWLAEHQRKSEPAGAGGPRHLYVSRAGLREGTLLCSNETAIEALARELGMAVVRPETLPLLEQLALFSRYDCLVGFPSSFFHLKILASDAPPAARVRLLVPEAFGVVNSNFVNLDKVFGFADEYGVVALQAAAERDAKGQRYFAADLASVRHALEASIAG